MCAVVTCIPSLQTRSASQTRPVGQIGFSRASAIRPMSIVHESLALLKATGASAHHRHENRHQRAVKAAGASGWCLWVPCWTSIPRSLGLRLREDVVEHASHDDGALCMNRQPSIVMELADTTVPLTLSAVTLPSVHGMALYFVTDIFIQTGGPEVRHLVGIAWQFWSRWLRIKPRTHRIVHMDALQRIRVLLVASLTALPHHGVAVLLGFEDAKLLWWIDLALRHELGARLHGHAMHKGTVEDACCCFTVCRRIF